MDRIVIPYPGPDDPGHIVVIELDELPYGTLHWQIRIDDGSGDDEIFAAEEDPNGVVPARLRTHLRDSLVQAFGIADQAGGGVPAPCEVVLPASYFDTPVHRWQLADEAPSATPPICRWACGDGSFCAMWTGAGHPTAPAWNAGRPPLDPARSPRAGFRPPGDI